MSPVCMKKKSPSYKLAEHNFEDALNTGHYMKGNSLRCMVNVRPICKYVSQ